MASTFRSKTKQPLLSFIRLCRLPCLRNAHSFVRRSSSFRLIARWLLIQLSTTTVPFSFSSSSSSAAPPSQTDRSTHVTRLSDPKYTALPQDEQFRPSPRSFRLSAKEASDVRPIAANARTVRSAVFQDFACRQNDATRVFGSFPYVYVQWCMQWCVPTESLRL